MLNPNLIMNLCIDIRKQTKVSIYMYTAKVDSIIAISSVLIYIDGICLTLYKQEDVNPFKVLNNLLNFSSTFKYILVSSKRKKSFRLNVFKDVNINGNLETI